VTGRYFAAVRAKRSSPRSYDEASAARLWLVSTHLVGLDDSVEKSIGRS
jgi:retinol dehydrogenase-14